MQEKQLKVGDIIYMYYDFKLAAKLRIQKVDEIYAYCYYRKFVRNYYDFNDGDHIMIIDPENCNLSLSHYYLENKNINKKWDKLDVNMIIGEKEMKGFYPVIEYMNENNDYNLIRENFNKVGF
jgi:hypothetical protein